MIGNILELAVSANKDRCVVQETTIFMVLDSNKKISKNPQGFLLKFQPFSNNLCQ